MLTFEKKVFIYMNMKFCLRFLEKCQEGYRNENRKINLR